MDICYPKILVEAWFCLGNELLQRCFKCYDQDYPYLCLYIIVSRSNGSSVGSIFHAYVHFPRFVLPRSPCVFCYGCTRFYTAMDSWNCSIEVFTGSASSRMCSLNELGKTRLRTMSTTKQRSIVSTFISHTETSIALHNIEV